MSAAAERRVPAGRPHLTLVTTRTLPPGLHARYRIERVRVTVTYHVRYRLLGDLILARVAPRRMREAAWRQGFASGRGSRQRQSWWLNTMPECEEGNVRALSLTPRKGPRLALVDPAARPGQDGAA